ncbi:MAG: transporter substrate-binding domain-containing protein [Anaerolineae bacterium]|jgi:polar amino acid transport system substrate-binding protein
MRTCRLVALCLILSLAVVACGGQRAEQATREALETRIAQATEDAPPTRASPPTSEAAAATPLEAAQPLVPQEPVLNRVLERGVLIVSTDANYAPQSFLNDDGEMDGFDVDVAKEVARRLGVELEFATPDWDQITAGHWGGQWDLSIGSMTPTEDRAEVLWFSQPYYYTPAAFAVHADNSTIETVDDLSGKTVGLGIATTYEDYLNGGLSMLGGEISYAPPPNVKIWQYLTDGDALLDMELGDGVRLDAVMTAQPTIQDAMNAGVPLRYVGRPAFYEPLVFALDKAGGEADEMLSRLNQIIAAMHEEGILSALSVKWYGIDLTTVQQE